MSSDLNGAVDSNILDFNNRGNRSSQLDLITVRNSRNAKFPDGIRDARVLTSSREAGCAKISARISYWERRRYSGKGWNKFETRDCREEGARIWDHARSPLPDPDRRKYCIRS